MTSSNGPSAAAPVPSASRGGSPPVADREALPDRVWTLPNALSVLRLLGVPLFLWLLLGPEADGWAVAVLMVSGFTDWLDGKLARWLNQGSRLGALLDPAADRLYIVSTLVALAAARHRPGLGRRAALGRELVLGVALLVLRHYGYPPLQVHYLGKAATLLLLYAFPGLLLADGRAGWPRPSSPSPGRSPSGAPRSTCWPGSSTSSRSSASCAPSGARRPDGAVTAPRGAGGRARWAPPCSTPSSPRPSTPPTPRPRGPGRPAGAAPAPARAAARAGRADDGRRRAPAGRHLRPGRGHRPGPGAGAGRAGRGHPAGVGVSDELTAQLEDSAPRSAAPGTSCWPPAPSASAPSTAWPGRSGARGRRGHRAGPARHPRQRRPDGRRGPRRRRPPRRTPRPGPGRRPAAGGQRTVGGRRRGGQHQRPAAGPHDRDPVRRGGVLVDFRPVTNPYEIRAIGDPDTLSRGSSPAPRSRARRHLGRTAALRLRPEDELTLPAASIPELRSADRPEGRVPPTSRPDPTPGG